MDRETWQRQVLTHLQRGGPICQHAAAHIRQHGTQIGFSRQSTGAKWTFRRHVELSADSYSVETHPSDRRMLGLVVHEIAHLEQGLALALSVEGEVAAWKQEFAAREELNAPIADPRWQAIAQTPNPPTDGALRRARATILDMTGPRYLIWLLPLRPNRVTRLIERFQRFFTRAREKHHA